MRKKIKSKGWKKMNVSDRLKRLTSKQKIVVGATAIIIVCGVAISIGETKMHKKEAIAHTVVNKDQDKLEQLTVKAKNLLSQEDKEFLAENITHTQVDELQKELGKFPRQSKAKTTVSDLLKKINDKLSAQETVNKLYKQDKRVALNGTAVNKDLPITDDLNESTVQLIKEQYKKEKPTTFDKVLMTLIDGAMDQVKQMDHAKQLVGKVFKENKVISTDHKAYDEAKKETEKIKNEKEKKALLDQLAKVKTEMDKPKIKTESKEKNQNISQNKQPGKVARDTQGITKATPNHQATHTGNQAQTPQNQPTTNGGGTQGQNGAGNQGQPTTPTAGNGGGNVAPSQPQQPSRPNGGSVTPSQPQRPSRPNNGGNTGGGSTTPSKPTPPAKPDKPSGPPAGWMVPPYPIGSNALWNWLDDHGYRGYDSSDGYIKSY